jgi:hypothetical protein
MANVTWGGGCQRMGQGEEEEEEEEEEEGVYE